MLRTLRHSVLPPNASSGVDGSLVQGLQYYGFIVMTRDASQSPSTRQRN
jgi:hypothetical protein